MASERGAWTRPLPPWQLRDCHRHCSSGHHPFGHGREAGRALTRANTQPPKALQLMSVFHAPTPSP